ncbi:MAG: pyridoxal phosphate-dependent aminotransferase [Thermoprotei archaeon]|nr:pyridoxal phosphate-dependent aminotransferase [Thermoprotei archaeon]
MEETPILEFQRMLYEIKGETAFTYLALARKLAAQGKRIISFGIGQPDYVTPAHIREEAKRALDGGFTGYTETAGIPELREAIAWYLNSRYGAGVSPDEIIATTGAKTAIFVAVASYVRPGDEVIIPDPSYYAYAQVAKLFGGTPVYVPMIFERGYGFKLDIEAVESAVTDKTRMIVLNNPHNPTGSVFGPEQLEHLYDIVVRRGLILVVDEIYDNFLYGNAKFKSILEFPDWKDYVVYVNGFSKTFSMTGWRLGYLVARKEAVDRMLELAVTVYSCAPSFVQKAGVKALKGDWSPVEEMVKEFERRAKVLYDILSGSDYVEAYMPQGAFYMFPRVSKILKAKGISVEDLVKYLLYEHGVLVLPGTAFSEGAPGLNHIRLSFATKIDYVIEGSKIIVEALEKLSRS